MARIKGGRAYCQALDSRLRGIDEKSVKAIFLQKFKFDSGLRPSIMGQAVI